MMRMKYGVSLSALSSLGTFWQSVVALAFAGVTSGFLPHTQMAVTLAIVGLLAYWTKVVVCATNASNEASRVPLVLNGAHAGGNATVQAFAIFATLWCMLHITFLVAQGRRIDLQFVFAFLSIAFAAAVLYGCILGTLIGFVSELLRSIGLLRKAKINSNIDSDRK